MLASHKRQDIVSHRMEHKIDCFSYKYTYQQTRQLLRYTNEEYTQGTTKHKKWNVKGARKIKCEGCGLEKGKQKNKNQVITFWGVFGWGG